jgi:hypothetical protein
MAAACPRRSCWASTAAQAGRPARYRHRPDAHRIRRLRRLDDTPRRGRGDLARPRFGPLKARAYVGIALQDLCRPPRPHITRAEDRVGAAPLPDWAPKHCVFHPAPRWDLSNGAASINTATGGGLAQLVRRAAHATSQRCPEAPPGRTRHMRYGIVGCGMMGQEHIRNIALLAQAEVSAFVEPDAGMAAATQALVPCHALPRPPTASWRATTSTRWSSPRRTTATCRSFRTWPAPPPAGSRRKARRHAARGRRGPARSGPRLPRADLGRDGIPLHAPHRALPRTGRGGHRRHQDADDPRAPLSPSSKRSATGTASTATPAARWSRNAAISST